MQKNSKYNRKKSTVDLGNMVFGKVPPQAKELEQAILGAIMLEKPAFDTVVEILKPECFYVDAHQRVYGAMISLAGKNMPIDMLTIVEELKIREDLELVGGPFAISKLTNGVVSSANIETHSRIVLQKFLQREMIRISGEIIGDAYEDSIDVFDLMDKYDKNMTALVNKNIGNHSTPLDKAMVDSIRRIEELRMNDADLTGITSGFAEIDRITHGWQNTDLIILAARPAVGKTAFALSLALSSVKSNVPTALFSLEMSTGQLVSRIMSAESGIWLDRITSGKLDDEQMNTLYTKAVQPLSDKKLFIDDTPALNIFELRSKCRRLKNKHNIGMIILDYLQLMSGDTNDSRNREREIAQISRGLKQLAKELQVPFIALSQLSREPDKRKGDDKTPKLSDLRESGAIEQDADMVMFMYRPEYYGENGDELGESIKGQTKLTIAKHRNGSLAIGNEAITLKAELHIQRFTPWNSMDDVKMKINNGGGNWRPVTDAEKGSKDDLPFK